ncbi:MAG: hypothetical protein H6828_13530 [Planctomycetes bacterium]|nr:hypothetical protein [Planctomycetota bacterium]
MILRPRNAAWLIAVVWFVWVHAAQELLGRHEVFGLATPDFGMVLFVGLLGAVKKNDVFPLALLAAVSRKGFSVDPGIAILGGFLALAWLAVLLRELVELTNPLWRAVLTAAGAMGLAFWLELVRYARTGGALPHLDPLLPLAFTSALGALALGGFAIRLPGLTPLRRRQAWS